MDPGTTIVTCVEAGPLESQVLLLAESLRVFGGSFGQTAFVAVKPRRGPAIASHTQREFKRLGVEFIDERLNVELDWWNNANKSAVMACLEQRVSTSHITWMDGDMVVLQPFDNLKPAPGTEFIARAGEGYLGSDGCDENAAYWRRLCDYIGINFDEFPMIASFPEGRQIHAYWQTGIYTYAVETRLGRMHYETICKLLRSSIGSRSAGIYHQDQVSISLAVQKLRLASSEYNPIMNFNINILAKQNADILRMEEVKILHYHNSFYFGGIDWAMGYVEQLSPDRIELIRKYTPLTANANLPRRVHKKFLKILRQRRVNQFKKQIVLC